MLILRFFIQNLSIFVLAGLLIVLTVGCVTTHTGREYQYGDSSLVVSCEKDTSVSHEHIKSLSCVFENTGSNWIEVQTTEFAPTASADEFVVLTPARIESFLTAYRFEHEKNRHNFDMALAGLVIGGAVLAAKSPEAGLGTIAVATSVGALSEINDSVDHASGGARFGAQHILGSKFEVPPKSFVRRSALIESKSGAFPRSATLCLQSAAETLRPDALAVCQVHSFLEPRQRRFEP